LIGSNANPWSSLPRCWLHIQLPGYRVLPEFHTYEGSQLEELPLIPIEMDDDCEWLMRHGTSYDRGGLDRYERDIQPCTVEHFSIGFTVLCSLVLARPAQR
jgi:hypothetical protein